MKIRSAINDSIRKLPMPEKVRALYREDLDAGEFDVYYHLARMIGARTILEVGVCCGFSALAMCLGSQPGEYTGIDAELFIDESNSVADSLLASNPQTSGVQTRFLKFNSLTQFGEIRRCLGRLRKFDWVHVDAGHEHGQMELDAVNFWPMVGRVMTIHDVKSHPHVRESFANLIDNKLVGYTSAGVIESAHGFGILTN